MCTSFFFLSIDLSLQNSFNISAKQQGITPKKVDENTSPKY